MDLSQANRLADMAVDMTEQPDLEHTLDSVLIHAQRSIPCDAAGILLLRDGALETAAVTDELVRRADDLQREQGDGPCHHPHPTVESNVIDDTRTDSRWVVWSRKVAEVGWRSVLSIRLCTPLRTLGALNLYAREPGVFGPDDVELGRIFGRHASVAVANAQYGDSLRAAVNSRHMIGQAQGILMERYRVDADRAFTVLRRYSQDKNVKLRVVAEQVIQNHRLPD